MFAFATEISYLRIILEYLYILQCILYNHVQTFPGIRNKLFFTDRTWHGVFIAFGSGMDGAKVACMYL